MSAHYRQQAALDAIRAILSGAARAVDLESQTLDFKEEVGTVRAGGRVAIDPRHEPAARALAIEVTCFANTERGGVLVVGLDDDACGLAAFVGTYLDTVWLRERIHALTQPHFAVDVIEERIVAGQRIYLIDVPPGLEEIRVSGESKLRARVGRDCVELSGDMARRLLESRRRYDWSAEPSGWRLSQAVPAALETATRYYRTEHGRTPAGTQALVKQLGLVVDDADDPELNNAGALLLCAMDPGTVQVDILATRAEGVASYERLERPAPLLLAFDDADQMLLRAFVPDHVFPDAQRREVRALPRRTFREALVNALMHRDYRLTHGRVDVAILGVPPTALKIRSAGGFPPGVPADRLLATPSRPRNPVLAHALHTLGLAEREGIGIDTMYLEMLRDGHPEPRIAEEGGDVICVLQGGRVDLDVRAFFEELAVRTPDLAEDVRAYIAVTLLLRASPLRPEALATAAQCGPDEALDILGRLEHADAFERLVDGSRSFRLTRTARERLRAHIAYPTRSSLDAHWEVLRAYLDGHREIGRDDAATLLGLKATMASRVLSALYRERGLIEPVGNARGPRVRYRLADRPWS